MASLQEAGAGAAAGSPMIAETTLDAFRADLDGTLARPGDATYVEATTIWNGMIAKRPSLVVRAASVEDVVRTVALAAEQGIELSIRGGGHNIAGLALSDGGITLDMSGFREIAVDPEARLASVGAGCLIGEVDRATQAHGLAAPFGFVSLTGVAGLTLGGGFGYLTRRLGWTVDSLEAVEIVLADGSVRRASRSEEPELFWALRGGGGNFGVVTEFVFRLHEVDPQVTAGIMAWPAARAEEVLQAFRDTTDAAPRELTLAAIRRNAPPAPWLPESAHGTPIVMVVACHSGTADQASADLARLRSIPDALADLVQVKEYTAQQALLDATQPKGMHYYWKSEFVPGLSDGLLETYHAQFEGLAAPANQIVLFHLAGALNERAHDDGAVGNRDAGFACVVQSMFAPDGPAEQNRAWVRSAWEALRAFGTGGNYVNFQTDDEPDDRTAASYGANFDRLRAVKQRYDPTNVFRVNRNIR
ncbi:MAG: FAD-binding oxidoreductase [Chloroflexota bacterium]|nr:FAD-binding oxidoreductase [Chloroflexota bacterium]